MIQRNPKTSSATLRDKKVTSGTAKNIAAERTLTPSAGDGGTAECVKCSFVVYPGDT